MQPCDKEWEHSASQSQMGHSVSHDHTMKLNMGYKVSHIYIYIYITGYFYRFTKAMCVPQPGRQVRVQDQLQLVAELILGV